MQTDQSDQDLELIFKQDPLELSRKKDVAAIEEHLRKHENYGEFFSHNWQHIKQYIRLENFHKDVFFERYDSLSRKIYILISGEVSAYVITKDTPKPISVYQYQAGDLLSEMGALFISPRHYGFHAQSDCQVVSLDLQYIEDEETKPDMYMELVELFYNETGRVCTHIFNYMLENKINLASLLGRYELFPNIERLKRSNLEKIADKANFVFLQPNEILLDKEHKSKIYIIESGTVEEIKTINKSHELTSISSKNLTSIKVNNNQSVQDVIDHELEQQDFGTKSYAFNSMLAAEQMLYDNYIDDSSLLDEQDSSNKVIIKEEVHRYGVVGEENLGNFENLEINAVTKTACCLLEVRLESVISEESIYSQIIGFFNKKLNSIQDNFINKQQEQINSSINYITYVNFSFFVMVCMSIMGISGQLFNYVEFSASTSLLYHTVSIAIVSFLLAYLLKPMNFTLADFGITTHNLRRSVTQALIVAALMIIIATGVKDILVTFVLIEGHENLFHPDLVVNDKLHLSGYIIYLLIYVVYLFIYVFCIRGIIQNIFIRIINGSQNVKFWGSVFASTAIGSQFHLSLFHEFSIVLLLGDLASAVVYANTRNLWATFIYRAIFSLYVLTILGLLPGSHF